MANKKISELTAITTPANADEFVVVDNSESETRKITYANLSSSISGSSQLSDLSDVNTSTATNRNVLVADGVDWESRALVEADISDLGSYITASSADSLTNKTVNLSSNTLTGTTAQFNTALSDGTFATSGGAFHDGFSDFVADEHVAHTGVTLTAGNGLTGGGDISSNRSFAVGAGTGVTVNANDVAVNFEDASGINTGTATNEAVNADALAGSYAGTKSVVLQAVEDATDVATGDGKAHVFIPTSVGGMNLVAVHAYVETAGTTNTTDVQIHNETQAADMLSTVITIDSTETSSRTAATPPVIDTNNDDVAAGDKIRIDVDAVSTTAPKGLWVEMEFRLP